MNVFIKLWLESKDPSLVVTDDDMEQMMNDPEISRIMSMSEEELRQNIINMGIDPTKLSKMIEKIALDAIDAFNKLNAHKGN